jgi:hypothetical protein
MPRRSTNYPVKTKNCHAQQAHKKMAVRLFYMAKHAPGLETTRLVYNCLADMVEGMTPGLVKEVFGTTR